MLTTATGKVMQGVLQRLSNSGQALPGLIIERLHPSYLQRMLVQLPEGVVIITGTNGKTTTTKIVAELLRASGQRVLTNDTGSNMTRGIISMIVHKATWDGMLPYDIAVLEMDEAYAKQFVTQVQPRWVLALNVSRDQLDRFGEVDAVARLIGAAMHAASQGVITNMDDPYLAAIGDDINHHQKGRVTYFGVSQALREFFPSDSQLSSVGSATTAVPHAERLPRVLLSDFHGRDITYIIDDQPHTVRLQVAGQHNFQNVAAALALVLQMEPDVPVDTHLRHLSKVREAFGRGEVYRLRNGSTIQLVLVKNPASFLQALASYLHHKPSAMIAINDNYADSRDVSWLWDVDFSVLAGVPVYGTTGSRAADMALRLQYDGITAEHIMPDLAKALAQFCRQGGDKVIFATYTAMMQLHKALSQEAGKRL